MHARGPAPTLGIVRSRWLLPFLAVSLCALVLGSAFSEDPRPALHGDGLLVLAALLGFLGVLVYGVLFRSRLVDPRPSAPLLGGIALGGLLLAVVQPDGAGAVALYVTLGVACVRLEPPAALGWFGVGVAAIGILHELVSPDGTWADTLVASASAAIFFWMGYSGRRWRVGKEHAEQLLAEAQAGREALAQAVALRERAHLAREMHDVLAHSLSALAVQLEGARLLARSRGADPAVVAAIERSHGLARGGLDEARRAIEALRGGDMPGPDRLPALAAAFRAQTGVEAELELDGEPRELPSDARLAVYRTAQEALTNVRRHAAAERVDLRLRYADDGTWLTVEDRGGPASGGDGAAAEPGLGHGLTGMRERAELLGGRLAATPTPEGFRVELFLPA